MDFFLRVGGITIALRCGDGIRCDWQDPMRRFLVAPVDPEVELTVRSHPPPLPSGGEAVFESDAVWRMVRVDGGYRIECRSPLFGEEPYKVATFDETFTRGTILLRGDLDLIHPLEYPLDEVLIANLLGRGRGVELHSCGVIDRDGRGRLFVGVSGAGKTTTARLWEGAASGIVSDDRVIVREQEGVMRMYGTPWHGEAELSLATAVPLAGVYLLTQADHNAIQPLPNAEAVARLFRCTFPPFYDAGSIDHTLSFLERLASKVPVSELRFRQERSIVELVMSTTAGAA
jgi:hypothetical protein